MIFIIKLRFYILRFRLWNLGLTVASHHRELYRLELKEIRLENKIKRLGGIIE